MELHDGILFEANTTQDYIVVGTDLNNCTNQDTVTVNILSLPTIDAGEMKLFVLEILFSFLHPEATITYGLLIIILLAITFQTQLSSLLVLLNT